MTCQPRHATSNPTTPSRPRPIPSIDRSRRRVPTPVSLRDPESDHPLHTHRTETFVRTHTPADRTTETTSNTPPSPARSRSCTMPRLPRPARSVSQCTTPRLVACVPPPPPPAPPPPLLPRHRPSPPPRTARPRARPDQRSAAGRSRAGSAHRPVHTERSTPKGKGGRRRPRPSMAPSIRVASQGVLIYVLLLPIISPFPFPSPSPPLPNPPPLPTPRPLAPSPPG